MDDEERKLMQEQMSLMGHLIGVCTDIKFELVNERIQRECKIINRSPPPPLIIKSGTPGRDGFSDILRKVDRQSGGNVSGISRIAAWIKRLFGWMS